LIQPLEFVEVGVHDTGKVLLLVRQQFSPRG
jgi:hypothetical protein